MKNEYNNLDFCINMYNDYIDSKDYDKYRIEPIVISEIDIDNILKPDNFDFKNILDNLEFYKKLNNKYIYFSNNSEINYEVNISKYSGNRNLLSTKENIGLVFHYVLSELNTLNKFNNNNIEGILINLMNFSVKKKEIKKDFDNLNDLDDDDLLLISIFERRDKTITLSDFIKKNKLTLNDYKIIFFKILFILDRLTDKYKNFRNNNLNLDSIRITNNRNPKKIKIKINNNNDNDNNNDNNDIEFIDKFIIKFTNFENAYSDSITKKTSKNISKNISKENPYYDIHCLFSSFMNFCLNNNIIIDDKISNFINQIIPEKYRTYENKKYKLDEEYYLSNQTEFISAKDLIKNIFFNDIINNNNIVNMNLSASPMSVSDSSLQNFNKKENKINYDIDSLTESSNNNFRMFAKNINYKNKKTYSQSNNIKDTMIHGTRRLYVPTKNVVEGNILSNVEKNERKNEGKDKRNRRKHVITEEEDTDNDVDVEVDDQSDDSEDKKKKSKSKVSSNEESSDEESSEKEMFRSKKSKKSKKSSKYDSESSLTSLSSDMNKVVSKLPNSRSQKEYSNFNAPSINKEAMGTNSGTLGNGINKIGELLGHSGNNMQAPNSLPMTAFGNSQAGMPEMGMQQMPGMGMGMGMPGMGMPGMGMSGMEMPGMNMQQMPQMGMQQMGMPQSINLSESGLGMPQNNGPHMPQNNGPQIPQHNEQQMPHLNNGMQSLNLNEPNISHAMQPQQGGSMQRGSMQGGSMQGGSMQGGSYHREFLQNKKVQLKLKKDFFF